MGRRGLLRSSQHRAHPDQRGLAFPGAHRREFFLLLVLGVIQDHPLEFSEHAVELRAGHVHRLQDAEHPGGLPFLLVPGIGDRRPGVLAADRPQHHFLSCLVHGQQDTQLIEGLLLASPCGCSMACAAAPVRSLIGSLPCLVRNLRTASGHCGGPAARCRRLVVCWPDRRR
jgi:hypothetical protein